MSHIIIFAFKILAALTLSALIGWRAESRAEIFFFCALLGSSIFLNY